MCVCVLATEGWWWWWGRRSLKTSERKNEGTRKARAWRVGKTVGRVAEEGRRGVIKLETRNHTGGRILNDSPTATLAQQPSLSLSLSHTFSCSLGDAINSDGGCQERRDRGMRGALLQASTLFLHYGSLQSMCLWPYVSF